MADGNNALALIEPDQFFAPTPRDAMGGLLEQYDDMRAREILAQLGDGSAPGTSLGLGVFHLLRADLDRAADFMTHAIEERYPGILFFLNGPSGTGVRASPRWAALRQLLNLPEGTR